MNVALLIGIGIIAAIAFGSRPKPAAPTAPQDQVVPPGGGPTSPGPDYTSYTVVRGDTLSLLARRFYGDALLWPTIYAANRDILSDPNRIYPGQVLKIPPKP
jgi:nucleoid-associated protein YgaU